MVMALVVDGGLCESLSKVFKNAFNELGASAHWRPERLRVSRKVGTLSVTPMNIKLLHFRNSIATVTGPRSHWALALDRRCKTFYGIDVAASGPIHKWLLALGPASLTEGHAIEPCWLNRRSHRALNAETELAARIVVLPAPAKGLRLAALFRADRPCAQADALLGLTRDGRLIDSLVDNYPADCVVLSKGVANKTVSPV